MAIDPETGRTVEELNREAVMARPIDVSVFTPEDLGAPPPPMPPAALPDFVPPSQSPHARPLGLGALIATLIGGPQSGGAAARGYLEGMKGLDAQAMKEWEFKAQQQARQDALYQQQEARQQVALRQRQNQFSQQMESFQKSVAAAKTRTQYENAIKVFSVGMQRMGFRMATPDYLRQQSDGWVSVSDQKLLSDQIDVWLKQHKDQLKNPLIVASSDIRVPEDGNPNGKPMRLVDAMRLAGRMTELTAIMGSGEQFSGSTQEAAKIHWMKSVASWSAEHKGEPPPDKVLRQMWDDALKVQDIKDEKERRAKAAEGIRPLVLQTPLGPMVTTGPDRTNVVPVKGPGGESIGATPTAGMKERAEARRQITPLLGKMHTMSSALITKVGPAQRADAVKRGVDAVFGNDPEFKAYQDARKMLAGYLAVAQQGSRPSDADLMAVWLPMIPDAYRDTKPSMDTKWGLIDSVLSAGPAPGYAFPGQSVTGEGDKEQRLKELLQRFGVNP